MINFNNVSMSYGDNLIIKNMNLHIPKGELVVLIGPSGCGKTTSLQLMNRLIDPDSGTIEIDGKDIHKVNVIDLRRQIGYVIQEIGLFPHMTIRQNIEIVPKLLKWDEKKRLARTQELMKTVGLNPEEFMDRYPAKMSGGQQQRIGFLRALAADPPIILLDEPFGALDPVTRDSLQDELKRLQKELNKTMVFVTHDMDEAIKIADRIVIMNEGQIVQYDTPEEILLNPANQFVEKFIGKHRLSNGNVNTVSEIMRSNPITIRENNGLARVISQMQSKRISTLLIVDEHNKYVGTVGIEALIDKVKPGMLVSDLEIESRVSVSPASSAKEAFDLLVKDRMDILVVTNDENEVVGVVTKTSMVESLASVVWKEEAHD